MTSFPRTLKKLANPGSSPSTKLVPMPMQSSSSKRFAKNRLTRRVVTSPLLSFRRDEIKSGPSTRSSCYLLSLEHNTENDTTYARKAYTPSLSPLSSPPSSPPLLRPPSHALSHPHPPLYNPSSSKTPHQPESSGDSASASPQPSCCLGFPSSRFVRRLAVPRQ